jgi:hypothetical protein
MSSPAAATTVKLHRALYAHDAIRRAAETFGDFASFSIRADGEHFAVEVSDIEPDVEGDVVAEFCNFALANTALRGNTADA